MKKVISIFVMVIAFTLTTNAQDNMMKKGSKEAMVETISLEQTKGVFTQENVTLKEGSYIFEISNNNVGRCF
jgi:hypothetical protein